MKITQVLKEAAQISAAFAYGRFNPSHQGHIAVWRTVENAATRWYIGTNPGTLGPNDPLTFEQKSAWMAEIYPPIAGHIAAEQSVMTLAAKIFTDLGKNEAASIAYITDADDWAWSGKLLNQYNGVEGRHGYYKFAEIVHVPSPRVSSATALRDAARADDKVAFYHASGTDPKLKVAGLTYFDTVKQAVTKYPLPVKKAKKVKEQVVAEGSESSIQKKIQAKQDSLSLAREQRRARGQRQQGPREIKLQAEIDRLNTELTQLKRQDVAEGIVNTIANKVMGAAPEQPKYKVGQRVKYETSPHQPDWKDGGSGVGVITDYKNGHYMINGNPVNHFEIKGVVEQGVAEAYDHNAPFNAADFNRHMDRLRAREELRKTDPMKALVGDMIDKDREKEALAKRKKPEDDSMSTSDPRHPQYSYTQAGQQGVAEGAPIVVMPSPERLKKAEPKKVDLSKIGTPAKPPSTEKRGVKGRPGQRPMPTYEEEVEEASLATMRDYFAGDKDAKDPTKLSQMRDFFSKHKPEGRVVDKRFNSKSSYEAWLRQQNMKKIGEDDEASEVEKTGTLIPFPKGTTKIDVEGEYDWYKLGQVISDLDDADPAQFGTGPASAMIAFGSETEEHKYLPLLKRLGMQVHDIDQPTEGVEIIPVAEFVSKHLSKSQGGHNLPEAEKIAGRYDPAEFDSMVQRLGKIAKAGPMKTVWDPEKRVYKTVPDTDKQKKIAEAVIKVVEVIKQRKGLWKNK